MKKIYLDHEVGAVEIIETPFTYTISPVLGL